MPSSWRIFGRAVEITTVVLLVLAVSYLWVNSDSEDTQAPQIPSQPPDAKTDTAQRPYRPPVPTSTDTGTYQQPVAGSPSIVDSPPADLYQPPNESPPTYISAGELRPCDVVGQFASTVQVEGMMPHEVVEQAVSGIQSQVRDSQDNYADDPDKFYELFNVYMLPHIDIRFAGGAVLGKHWRTATADQRDRFTCAFQTIFIRRWADFMSEIYQYELTILPYIGDASKRTTVVKTTRLLVDGYRIPVHYTLVNREDQWRIFDVTIEGVSYVRNYRKEFDSEIEASSIEAMITRLEREAQYGTTDGGE